MAIVVRRACLRQRQLRPHPARGAGGDRRRQPRPRRLLRCRRVDRAPATCARSRSSGPATVFPVFNGTGANVVGLRSMLRAVAGRDLRRERAPERRRGRRARAHRRLQAADRARRPTASSRRSSSSAGSPGSATSTSSSRGVDLGHAVDRARDALLARGAARRSATSRTRTGCCSTSTARGSRTPRRRSDVLAARDHDRRRRRRRLARRHEDRAARGRGGRRAEPRRSPRSLLYLRKQSMQLASKMRFVSAQLLALLEDEVWRRAAGNANAMARAAGRRGSGDALEITQAVQANGVFAILPAGRRRGAAARRSSSTSGTSTPARCAGCAPGTRPRRTSTRSSPRSSMSHVAGHQHRGL